VLERVKGQNTEKVIDNEIERRGSEEEENVERVLRRKIGDWKYNRRTSKGN